jgi:hypothetical protein
MGYFVEQKATKVTEALVMGYFFKPQNTQNTQNK